MQANDHRASIIVSPPRPDPDQTAADGRRTLCEAGVDFIKDDEKMMSPAYSPFEARGSMPSWR